MHFGLKKLRKGAHFANKAAKHTSRIGMKAGKVVEAGGKIGVELGVPGSSEAVMAGRKTQQVSRKIERGRRTAVKASRMV